MPAPVGAAGQAVTPHRYGPMPHHLDQRIHGGDTKRDRMLSLCRSHHVMVHEGRWRIDVNEHTGEVDITRPDGTPYELGHTQAWTGPTTRRAGWASRVRQMCQHGEDERSREDGFAGQIPLGGILSGGMEGDTPRDDRRDDDHDHRSSRGAELNAGRGQHGPTRRAEGSQEQRTARRPGPEDGLRHRATTSTTEHTDVPSPM
jgi:hypothetical protein